MVRVDNIHIAVVGHQLSGKDAVADYLVKKYGFKKADTGAILREFMQKHQIEATREEMIRVSNELRSKYGPDYFAKKALEISESKLVVTGLRVPQEVDTIKTRKGHVIHVDSPVEIRYERAQKRLRVSDITTFEDFKRHEEIESYSTESHKQNINAVIKKADFSITNTGSKEELYEQVETIISKITSQHTRIQN